MSEQKIERREMTFCGLRLLFDETLPPNAVEFRHPDGRVDRFLLPPDSSAPVKAEEGM